MIRLEVIGGASLQGKRFPLLVHSDQLIHDVSTAIANKFHLRSLKQFRIFARGVEYECTLSQQIGGILFGVKEIYILSKSEAYRGPSEEQYTQDARVDVSVIASPEVYIDAEAVEQVLSLTRASNGDILKAVCMPDLHHGPTGVAILASRPMPKLPGYDIGCGMGLFRTSIPSAIRVGEVRRRLSAMNLDTGEDPSDPQFGTIGGGNHFAELLRIDDTVPLAAEVDRDLDPSVLYLLVHSGSRSHGERVFAEHREGRDPEGYMTEHSRLCEWARGNRREIARRFLDQFCGEYRLERGEDAIVDMAHNWIERLPDKTFLHRKGAAPAYAGSLSLLPGSRGTASYVLISLGHTASLCSMAHGAGHKLSRADARERVDISVEDLTRDGTVVCGDKSLLKEEAPEAYKDVEAVVRCMCAEGMCRVAARLLPVATYKSTNHTP